MKLSYITPSVLTVTIGDVMKRLILLSLTLIMFGIGCEGPEGPAGRDAEVAIFSQTIQINDTDFIAEDEFISIAEYTWNILDEQTVDEGIVLAYLRFNGTTAWHPLPLTTPFENDVVVLRFNFDIDSFNLILEGEVADNNDVNEEIFDGDTLRVVVIPPDQLIKAKVDYSNYEQVARLYGLPIN